MVLVPTRPRVRLLAPRVADVKTVVFVGEAPGPKDTTSRTPLWSIRKGSAGSRLRAMTGLDRSAWTRRVPKFNLVPYRITKWPREFAEQQAQNLSSSLLRDCDLVLCGRKVARAFGVPSKHPWLVWTRSAWGPRVVVIPHPSGLCREYNDPEFVKRASRFLKRVLRDYERQ